MKDLMFFDANAVVGNTLKGVKPGCAELLKEMDRNGVDKALVRHGNMAAAGAVIANREINSMLKEAAGDRLYGVWGILPQQCSELPAGDELFAAMKLNNIKAFTLMPDDHRYVACRLTIGKLMDEAAERKIPVLLHGLKGGWKAVYDFMKEFPHIYAIVSAGHKWGSDRNIRPLLENYKNLYVELAGYWVPEGVRDLVEIYGSDRILYGSGFPTYGHGSTMLQIRQSGLNSEDIAKIAGLNMARLIEGAEI